MSAALQKIIKDLRSYSEWAGKPDVLEEAISELEAQQAQAGWRDIATAPKDMGTYLFLCNGVSVQGFRDATGELCVCIEAGASGNPPWRRMRRKPTHWAPLLAAPQQGAKP